MKEADHWFAFFSFRTYIHDAKRESRFLPVFPGTEPEYFLDTKEEFGIFLPTKILFHQIHF
jgi:hypothetical protein